MYSAGCSRALCQRPGPLPVPLTACCPAVAKLSPQSQGDMILNLSTAFWSWVTRHGELEPLL